MRVGFVGLGNQGGPIARRIGMAGFPLAVWARRTEAMASFAAVAYCSDRLSDLAAACDMVCLCVVDDAGIREVAEQALDHMPEGSLLAILSTVHPETCQNLAKMGAARGIAVIDAPVSGGGSAAERGELTVMMGGASADCERARPVFDAFGGLVVRLGGIGAGQRAKLVNNALLAAILDMTQTARETGRALGLDPASLDAVIAASSGNSFGHGILRSLPGLGAFAAGAALLAKDVRLLAALADESGIDASTLLTPGTRFTTRVDRDGDG